MKVVFAGPSLPNRLQPKAKDVIFLSPARCGDVHHAAQNGATHVCVIDGTFETGMSVWHKEIIYALEKGVIVAGSSSMGALRAAECATYGMRGFGTIFEDYHSGARTRDADVALIFAPQELDYQPLSITVVDLEATLAKLVQVKKMELATAAQLITAARSIFYKKRTLQTILNVAFGGTDATIEDLLTSNWVDQKQTDALFLLAWLEQF